MAIWLAYNKENSNLEYLKCNACKTIYCLIMWSLDVQWNIRDILMNNTKCPEDHVANDSYGTNFHHQRGIWPQKVWAP